MTPTQARIMALLSDGELHRREEIRRLLPDDLGAVSNIKAHISALRRRLRPGEYIDCVLTSRGIFYRYGAPARLQGGCKR